jgi:phosphatidylethanolamine-binding protein (PEBP) family uncharacterized protein
MARTRGGRRTCASRGAVLLFHVGLGFQASSCALDFPKPEEVAAQQPAMDVQVAPGSAPDGEDRANLPVVSGDAGAAESSPIRPPTPSAAPAGPAPAAQPDAGTTIAETTPTAPAIPSPVEPFSDTEDEEFVLTPVGFGQSGEELTFPERALPPYSESPAFSWRGVPEGTRSLALVLREQELDVVNWILWDISPSISELPPDLGSRSSPPEVPGSSQLGSVSNGYSGPLLVGGRYEFTLWALDIEMLPNTFGRSVNGIVGDVLPMHVIDTTEPIVVTYDP